MFCLKNIQALKEWWFFIYIYNINLFNSKNNLSERQLKLKQKVDDFKIYLQNLKKEWSVKIFII